MSQALDAWMDTLVWSRATTERNMNTGILHRALQALKEYPAENINDGAALWFFMAANKGAVPEFVWSSAGLTEAFVASLRFLDLHAPGLTGRIDVVPALGLSYAEAFDLLIGAGGEAVDLPELVAVAMPGGDISQERL